jgi:ribosomal protein S18 acetylase RimI-like enzyme
MVTTTEPSLESSQSTAIDYPLIMELEARTFSAWSPLDQIEFGGWRLGCAQGYTRRANSVYPLAWSSDEAALHTQIDACERWYRDHQQAVCFKLTAASQPTTLSDILDTRGYAVAPGAFVMSADLTQGQHETAGGVSIETQLTERWLEALCEMNAAQAPHKAVIRQMLANDQAERYFATAYSATQPAAVGLAVRDGDYIGLFDIVTDESARRQGYGRRLVQALLHAGLAAGARTAYLQVIQRNVPAIALYESLGFVNCYEYWYRQKP